MGTVLTHESQPDTQHRARYTDTGALWLLVAGALLLVADGRNTIALAAWLAPVCLLRFIRLQPRLRGLLIAYAVLVLTRGISLRGMVPIPGALYYIFAVISGFSALLPYIADRLLAPHLKSFAGTLIFPCTLVAVQFVYSYGPQGSWGTMAYTQAGNLRLLQLLSVTGVWGITFLIGWFAPVVNEALERPRRLLPLGVFTAVYLSILMGGAARLAFFPPSSASVRIASLSPAQAPHQPAIDLLNTILRGDATSAQVNEFRSASYTVQQDLLTRSAREAAAGAKIVFWSETAAYVLAQDEPQLLAQGRELAAKYQIYLGMAVGTWTPGAPRPLQNKLVLIDPSGHVVWQFLKARPTPGPEAAASVKSDGKLRELDTPYGRIVGAICYDMDFPSLMRQAGAKRADIVISPAGDWKAIDPRHTQMADFRAIEEGFNLARQTNKGLSAVYDYEGHQLAHMDHYQAADLTMVAQIPTRGVPTLYSVLGDWLAWLCVSALLLLVLLAKFRPSAVERP
jgi:apolipoprotein N-acyltransferase